MEEGYDMSTPLRRKLNLLVEDLRDIRDQGKKAVGDSNEVSLFKGMHLSIGSTYEQFEAAYEQLSNLVDDSSNPYITPADQNLRKTARRYYFEAHSIMVTINEVATAASSKSHNSTSFPHHSSVCLTRARAKLPTINIPTFDGERKHWPRFRDLFESLVIGDPELTDVDKHHYLVASLKEPASSVISNLPISTSHFSVAWTALKAVYDNKRLLAVTYLDQILDMKRLDRRPSSEVLASRVSELSEAVSAFKLLNIPDAEEFIFFHLASRSLDENTRLAFENNNSSEFPSFDLLIEFIRKRSVAAELATSSQSDNKTKSGSSNFQHSKNLQLTQKSKATVLFTNSGSPSSPKQFDRGIRSSISRVPERAATKPQQGSTTIVPCFICKANHQLAKCEKLGSASITERQQLLQNFSGCRNCLQNIGHATRSCPSRWRCKFCQKMHHTLLHFPQNDQSRDNFNPRGKSSVTSSPNRQSSFSSKPVTGHTTAVEPVNIMLGTAMCQIINKDGLSMPARLVLDSGSHFSFVTQDFASCLGLHIEPKSPDIWGIGETPLNGFKGRTKCSLSPLNSDTPALTTDVVVVETITASLPGVKSSSQYWKPYLDFDLADPEFWIPKPVDFLLGCDLFADVLTGQLITISPGHPKLLGTMFGFTVIGRVEDLSEASQILALHARPASTSDTLSDELQRFWDLEEPPSAQRMNPIDEACERHFKATHYRLTSGQYGVRLPFKIPNPEFKRTKELSLKRLYHIESKLERNQLLKSKYHDFMQEYLDLGHMSMAKHPAKVYIPHHCVTKGEGKDMKIRVVFDAAARSTSGSLNDTLMIGPKLQADIVTILLNFRIHTYVFTTDAVKMFRQIEVHPEDRQFQHIFFRFDPAGPVQEYELNTVTYGTSCAPYLAHRVLRQLNEDEGKAFPLATIALEEDVYVDDFATGAATLPEALDLQSQLMGLMEKGGFRLGKWSTNHPDLTAACPQEDVIAASSSTTPVTFEPSDCPTVKILGLQWSPDSDHFTYKISPPAINCTKRSVLSSVAKIYDPLGYLGPTVLLAKEIIQASWKLKLGWDQPLPPELQERWTSFISQLPTLAEIHIPRRVFTKEVTSFNLLMFADASERAYCATAYIHSTTSEGTITNLLLAKTKLAPVKVLTIARLELCAALLAVRLRHALNPFCKRAGIQSRTFFFTDSTVVLAWISTPTYRLKTFVANRVEAILEHSTADQWHHVTSAHNPSDLGSRGLPPALLLENSLWFHGPEWASRDCDQWDLKKLCIPDEIPEIKPSNLCCTSVPTPSTPYVVAWMENLSSFSKVTRVLAVVLRFKDSMLASINRGQPLRKDRLLNQPISLSEIRAAELAAVKITQAHFFFNKPFPVDNTQHVPKSLHSLQPFFDDRGVLLVGGRLRNSFVSWSRKHPILLPNKAHLSLLIIKHYHEVLLHPGATILLAAIRSKYWIVGAKSNIRQLSRQCVICRKLGASPCQPLMGDLPSSRFKEIRPFLHVGIDFAGPFVVRETTRRKAPCYKTYLCLFVCLSTKALHLEIVSSLSTDAFCAALERFIGRRGKPERILSDNGTNFVGASNHLKELYKWYSLPETQSSLTTLTADKEIEWTFNPAQAPSFGGVWEAGVKSVKRLLRSVYSENVMTFEELGTWFVRIEAILNSRPLCPLSADPNDLSYLSPGDFLIGSPLLAIPEKSLVELPENRLSRWQLVSQKSQHFWNRWRSEYLSNLQLRTKWRTKDTNLNVGDLVIIKDEQTPRLRWPMARVVEVHPGPDHIVRVVTVKTCHSTLRRPVNKLVPLFLPSPSNNQPDDSSSTNNHNF